MFSHNCINFDVASRCLVAFDDLDQISRFLPSSNDSSSLPEIATFLSDNVILVPDKALEDKQELMSSIGLRLDSLLLSYSAVGSALQVTEHYGLASKKGFHISSPLLTWDPEATEEEREDLISSLAPTWERRSDLRGAVITVGQAREPLHLEICIRNMYNFC